MLLPVKEMSRSAEVFGRRPGTARGKGYVVHGGASLHEKPTCCRGRWLPHPRLGTWAYCVHCRSP